ncbi:MAG: hypothetical protein ACJAU2_000906 [Maribacter sp.]|jgi:hypothetical protein
MNTSFNAIQNLIEKHSGQEVFEKKNTNEPVPLHWVPISFLRLRVITIGPVG